MRIPIFIAIPVCVLTVIVIWWSSTHDMDFLTPPPEARLEEIRTEALASLPVAGAQDDAITAKVTPSKVEPIVPANPENSAPPVLLGDLTSPPTLDAYTERVADGPDNLLRLAAALEANGAFQRALLAYERVLDFSQANADQTFKAVKAVQRLRPTIPLWNLDPEKEIPIVIHIGTGQKFGEILPEVLEQITSDLTHASSGMLGFSHQLNIGRSIQATDAPTPVAVWITGGDKGSPSTDVLSFTTDNPETLRNDLLKTVFNLIRGHLSKSTAYSPAPEAWEEPLTALESHFTRLLWYEFGVLLNSGS